MFDWIPVEIYSSVYYYFLLIILLIFITYSNLDIKSDTIITFSKNVGYTLLITSILYIGLRPINGKYFGDMLTYNKVFIDTQMGIKRNVVLHDIYFYYFMETCTKIMNNRTFFFVLEILYIIPIFLACKKWFKDYWGFAFYIIISSFSFWGYGTNGLRNGIATSFVLLGIAMVDKKIFMILSFLIASMFHKTTLLPIFGFIVTIFYNDSKKLMIFWLLCIPLSLVLGGAFETFFVSLGFDDDRLSYLTAGNVNGDNFSHTGFRWDFLLYSATAVYAGYYFVFKKNINDKVYQTILNIYIIANAFWILIIRANFSNRFAYLSWFMIGIVIVYPFLKNKFFENQNKILVRVFIFYFLFTFVMNVIIG